MFVFLQSTFYCESHENNMRNNVHKQIAVMSFNTGEVPSEP